MKHSKNIWSLLIQKKHAVCAALAAVILVMMQAACTVLEVIVLQRFLDGFSAAVLRLGQSLSCIAVLAAIYAFRYFRTPLLNWLNGSITLQLRESLEHLIIKKAARISLVRWSMRIIRRFSGGCRMYRKSGMQMDCLRYLKS